MGRHRSRWAPASDRHRAQERHVHIARQGGADLKLGKNMRILGAQAGATRGTSMQHTGAARPRPCRRPAGSLLRSSIAAVGLPAAPPLPLLPPLLPPRLVVRSHQLRALLGRCCRFLSPPSSCGSALKVARREGRPTEEIPWLRASLHKSQQVSNWECRPGSVQVVPPAISQMFRCPRPTNTHTHTHTHTHTQKNRQPSRSIV
jgi:hypothetical protein